MPVIATGFALVGAGFGSILFARTVPALAACIVVFTLGEMCAMPVASAYVAGLASGDMRGRYMGAYGLTWTVAQVLAPGLGMRLFAADATLYWVMCGALGLASAAVLLGWAPSRGPAAEGAGA
jgi:MFS family permease